MFWHRSTFYVHMLIPKEKTLKSIKPFPGTEELPGPDALSAVPPGVSIQNSFTLFNDYLDGFVNQIEVHKSRHITRTKGGPRD